MKFHPEYGSRKYRDLKPGESIEDPAEVHAAREYMRYRRKRGLPHLNLKLEGKRVVMCDDV